MQSASIVLTTVLAVLAVMAVGAALRRLRVVEEAGAKAMARIVADVAFPALCFEGLVRSDAATLRSGVAIVSMGFLTLALASGVGVAIARAVPERSRPTAVFAIAIGNWIFLPLPVAEALFGASGTTAVLLHNVGAQLFLWTAGIVILRRGRFDASAARAIASSPGLWATLAGIVVASVGASAPDLGIVGVLRDALHAIASLTIPLVSLAIGAQLAAPAAATETRSVLAVVFGRMLAAPLVVSIAIELTRSLHRLPHDARMTEHLIAAMPVSLSAAALVERYDGDVPLVSRAILVTTLLSAVTAPLWVLAMERLTG
jgi:predicted permease